MRKFYLLGLMLAIIVMSCKKDEIRDPRTDQKFVSGTFTTNSTDITLKSAPLVGGHWFSVYKAVAATPAWALVDGSEFLPGSYPAIDWARVGVNPIWLGNGGVYITYCPIMPLRVITEATVGGAGTAKSYLGIKDVTPSVNGFAIAVEDRRLGDVLQLNANALTSLPGYSKMQFDITYEKSVLDLNQIKMKSPDTSTGWFTPYYSSSALITSTILNSTGTTADYIIYDGLDCKITGKITVKVYVDGTRIDLPPVDAFGMGFGTRVELTTTKLGWYNSGTLSIRENDITIKTVKIPVN